MVRKKIFKGAEIVKLGVKKDEVKLVDYTPEWNEELNRVKSNINLNIEENRIEHIGSTAIKDMSAKPILDIIVGIDDIQNVDEAVFSGLKNLGFLRLRVERPNEIILAKFTDKTYEEKTHYIHLVEFHNELWDNLTFFRDYLNHNEDARKEYLEVKLEYLKNSTTGVNEYTDYKEEFVKKIIKKRTS
ncbi:GrpB-like predicted nucleotidyltransferase (UPF0157 family) [Natronobacillus azotifigens]